LTPQVLQEYNSAVDKLATKQDKSTDELKFLADYFSTVLKFEAFNLPENLPTDELPSRLPDSTVTIKLNELVVKPELFDGKNPKPRKWIEDFIDAYESNGWNDTIAVKYFKTWLIGPAKDWYVKEVRPYITKTTKWSDIYEKFKEQYLVTGMLKLQHFVNNVVQRSDEPIELFIPRYRRALQMLHPLISQAELVRKIIEKLRPEYKKDVILYNPSTVMELHQYCVRIEMGLTAQRGSDSGRSKPFNRSRSKRRNSMTQSSSSDSFPRNRPR